MLLISKFNTVEEASKVLEEDLKIKLPVDYAKFLDKYNGGTTYKTTLKIRRRKDIISGFYGVGDVGKGFGFTRMNLMGVLDEYIEKQLLPVASNVGGDDYCLSLKKEDYGFVYLVYHDLLGKKKVITSSFSEFIKNCNSEPIGHIPTMEEREKRAIDNGYADEVDDLRPLWKKEIEKFSTRGSYFIGLILKLTLSYKKIPLKFY